MVKILIQRKAKIKAENYVKEKKPIHFSQKKANVIVGAGVGVLFLANIVLVGVMLSGYKPTKTVVTKTVQSSNGGKKGGTISTTDYQAKAYLDSFVNVYFNYPAQPQEQSKWASTLNTYYGGQLAIVSQGQQRVPSELKSMVLMKLSKNSALYDVTYSTGIGNKAVTTSTAFNIPFNQSAQGYVVSNPPTFEAIQNLQSELKNVPDLTATDKLSKSDETELVKYTKSLFQAYTSNQNTLDLISKDLSVNVNESLKSVDYTYFAKEKDGSYQAVVQATFKNAMGTHPENWAFHVKKQGNTYFSNEFSHEIPSNYSKQ